MSAVPSAAAASQSQPSSFYPITKTAPGARSQVTIWNLALLLPAEPRGLCDAVGASANSARVGSGLESAAWHCLTTIILLLIRKEATDWPAWPASAGMARWVAAFFAGCISSCQFSLMCSNAIYRVRDNDKDIMMRPLPKSCSLALRFAGGFVATTSACQTQSGLRCHYSNCHFSSN